MHGTQDRHAGILPRTPARPRIILRVIRRQLHLPWSDPLGRRRRQYWHRIAARTAGPRRGGEVLEQRAVRSEWRISAGRADYPLGVWGLKTASQVGGGPCVRRRRNAANGQSI